MFLVLLVDLVLSFVFYDCVLRSLVLWFCYWLFDMVMDVCVLPFVFCFCSWPCSLFFVRDSCSGVVLFGCVLFVVRGIGNDNIGHVTIEVKVIICGSCRGSHV